jgi:hypothetical protein
MGNLFFPGIVMIITPNCFYEKSHPFCGRTAMIRNYLPLLIISLFSSCIYERHGYYLSPNNANANPYRPIPLKSDSIRSAYYANLVYSIGSANDKGFDQVSVAQISIHRGQNFGIFQAYYGGNLSLGTYKVSEFYNSHYRIGGGWFSPIAIPYDTIYHIAGNRQFFGGYGVSGGINLVIKSPRGEWRALGLETSIQNEFGNYSDFRKSLPDSAANIIFRKTLAATIGLYTDMIWKSRHNVIYGFKFAGGIMINPVNNYSRTEADHIFPLTYVSTTFHMTKDHYTGFTQINLGTYADNFQLGLSYRLGKK